MAGYLSGFIKPDTLKGVPARTRGDRPAHCTGWRAQHAMSARFPAAYIPNSVGTSFHLTADEP